MRDHKRIIKGQKRINQLENSGQKKLFEYEQDQRLAVALEIWVYPEGHSSKQSFGPTQISHDKK